MTLHQYNVTISSHISAETASSQVQKPPPPVQNAVVKSVSHSCAIEWNDKPVLTNESVALYKVCRTFLNTPNRDLFLS